MTLSGKESWLIVVPTAPRRVGSKVSGILTRCLDRLSEEIHDERFRVVLLDCSRENELHQELLEYPVGERKNWRVLRRQGPFIPEPTAAQRCDSDRLLRDGLASVRWSLQQSLDFLEILQIGLQSPEPFLLRLEDDGLPCRNFVRELDKIPGRLVGLPYASLFSVRVRLPGQTAPHCTGAVALAFARGRLAELKDYVESQLSSVPFDVALGWYRDPSNQSGKELFPSCVQHIGTVRTDPQLPVKECWTSPTFSEHRSNGFLRIIRLLLSRFTRACRRTLRNSH